MKTILVMRFSAVGDVAMTVPVLHAFVEEYPQVRLIVLSRDIYQPLFQGLGDNVVFVNAHLKDAHKGIKGLYRLFRELKGYNINCVADLHDVLRSKYLSLLFRLSGIPVARIQKGRRDKQALCRKNNKSSKYLISTFERYRKVFTNLGYPFPLTFTTIFKEGKGDLGKLNDLVPEKGPNKWIGIAPFARHQGKVYPLKQMEEVVKLLSEQPNVKIFLFGRGDEEAAVTGSWTEKYPQVFSVVNKTRMDSELIVMSHLDVMLSMDSANMHFASLVDVPVVSIWGATSPKAGFMGWNQKLENCLQLDMSCRPCSVFGNKPCLRKDYACMAIPPETVAEKLLAVIR